jgi:MSHA biogenesis protein MshM
LSNLETEKRKLLQIVLFGQPELDRRLAREEIRQLAQRISFHYRLRPLSLDETQFYITHRLRVAGYSDLRLFSRFALWFLWWGSGGIPRMLNILANKAMMLAYGEGNKKVVLRHVVLAVKDTEAAPLMKRSEGIFKAMIIVGVVCLLIGLIWQKIA